MNFKSIQQFVVPCQDQPGTLAALTEILSSNKINITAISTTTGEGMAYVKFSAEPEAKVEAVLKKAGYQLFTKTLWAVELPNTPGQLQKLCVAFGKEKVNIEGLYGYTMGQPHGTVLFTFDHQEKAKQVIEKVLQSA